VPEELWMEVHNIVQEALTTSIPQKKRNAKGQNGCLRRPCKYLQREEVQKADRKGKDIPI